MPYWKKNGFKATGEQFLGLRDATVLEDRVAHLEPSTCVPERIECEKAECQKSWNPVEHRSLSQASEMAYHWDVTCPGCGATGNI